MPESFDGMLAELADAAAAVTPLPDVATVRRRAQERTARRRLGASALVLVLLGTCGGALAAISGHFKPRSEVAASAPGAAAKVTTAATPPDPVPEDTTPTPDTAAVADATAYAAVAGTWQPNKGGRYLVVFPDGEIGMGEAGAWQLCDGELAAAGSGDFYVEELACGDYGTTGLQVQSTAQGKELALAVPSRSGAAGYTVSYQRTGTGPTAAAGPAVLAKLVGEWTSVGTDKRSVLVAGNGTVSLVGFSAAGGIVHYAGTVTAYYTDGVRVEIPCSVKPGAQPTNADCGVIELQQLGAKQITVVGSDGPEAFLLTGRTSSFGTSSQPSTATSTRRPTASTDPLSSPSTTAVP